MRLKLLAPLAIVCIVFGLYMSEHATTVLLWTALAIVATWAAIELWVRQPLEKLGAFASLVARGDTKAALPAGVAGLEPMSTGLVELQQALARAEERANAAVEQRREAEAATRETEERYMLAVRGTNDGLWEWNIRGETAYFSPRWKSMLGYTDETIGSHIDEWRDRIHPDDRERAIGALEAHLEGASPRYESEQRLRAADGRYRWVLVRGAALRNSAGRAYRLIGLNTDISERKHVEEIVMGLSVGLENVRDDAFFATLARNFATVLGVKCAFIAECVGENHQRARILARWDNGKPAAAGDEYDIAGAPCELVINERRTCVYPRDLAQIFPREAGLESYVGIPMFDSANYVIGHLVAIDPKPLIDPVPAELIFSLFAVRASLELERRHLLKRLRPAA